MNHSLFRLLLLLLFFTGGSVLAQVPAPLLGIWKGESLCTVPDSPCHNERVIYKFKSAAGKLHLDAFKIVSNHEEFMGTLDCTFHDAEQRLTCGFDSPKPNVWEFRLSGNELTGTLVVGPEKTLYRKIHVTRQID